MSHQWIEKCVERDSQKDPTDRQTAQRKEKKHGLLDKARAYFNDRIRGIANQPAKKCFHLRPRLSNPTSKPATNAMSTAANGLRSIVDSKSALVPATRSCALLAVSDIFCFALSTASATVVVVAAACEPINSNTD